jgi:trigger factor
VKILKNKEESRTVYITAELEPAELEQYMNLAYRSLVQQVEVPGFRKGNAPREVLEQHVGRSKMLEQVKKEYMPMIYSNVITNQKLQIAGRPMVKIQKEEPLTFDMVVPLKPIVEVGDYKSIRLQPEPVEITEKQIQAVLDNVRRQSATYEKVDRPVEQNDLVSVQMEGTYMESPCFRNQRLEFPVLPEYPPEIPGLSDYFIGMKKDEEKEFKHKLPDNFFNKLLAGKEVNFKIKILEVKKEILPSLDDSFAARVAPDLKTLDALKELIAQNLKIEAEQKSVIDYEEKIIETVVNLSKLEIPPILVDYEANYLFEDGLRQFQKSCSSKEEFEQKMKEIPMDRMRKEYHEIAEKRVRWNLLSEEIQKKENIEAAEEEIDAEIERILQSTPEQEKEEQRRQLEEPMARENVRDMVVANKVVGLLIQIAQTPGEEAVAEKAAEAPAEKKSGKKKKKEE